MPNVDKCELSGHGRRVQLPQSLNSARKELTLETSPVNTLVLTSKQGNRLRSGILIVFFFCRTVNPGSESWDMGGVACSVPQFRVWVKVDSGR